MHHPIERSLLPHSVGSAEKIYEVVVRHQERSFLDGAIVSRVFDGEEFDFWCEVVPRGLFVRSGRFVIDEDRAVGDPFHRPVQPSRFVLDDVYVRIEQMTFAVEDQAEVVIVTMPDGGAQS